MRIVVAGDVIVDHQVYEGERLNPAAVDARGLRVVREHGGAYALCELIRHVLEPYPAQSVKFGLNGRVSGDQGTVMSNIHWHFAPPSGLRNSNPAVTT